MTNKLMSNDKLIQAAKYLAKREKTELLEINGQTIFDTYDKMGGKQTSCVIYFVRNGRKEAVSFNIDESLRDPSEIQSLMKSAIDLLKVAVK